MSTRFLRKTIFELWHAFRAGFWPMLAYVAMCQLLLLGAVVPLLRWLALIVLVPAGGLVLSTSGEMVAFLLQPATLAVLVLGVLSAWWLTLVGVAGMLRLAGGQSTSWMRALGASLRDAAGLCRLGAWQGLSYVIAMAGFLGLLMVSVLWTGPLSPMFSGRGGGALAYLAALSAFHAVMLVWWLFSLAARVWEGADGGTALKRGWQLLKGSWLHTLILLGGWTGGVLAVYALGRTLLQAAGDLLAGTPWVGVLVVPVLAGLVLLELVVVLALGFLWVSVLGLLLAQLYRAQRGADSPPHVASPRGWRLQRHGVWAMVLGACLLTGGVSVALVGQLQKDARPTVTAHRGSSMQAPENTLAAVRHAIQAGADVVEIDVQLTADGEVVVFHDEDLLRVAGVDRRVARDDVRTVAGGRSGRVVFIDVCRRAHPDAVAGVGFGQGAGSAQHRTQIL